MRKAEERLRTIEMISKYREDKIKAEFRKLESDLKAQDMKEAMERQRGQDKRNFYKRLKEKHMSQPRENQMVAIDSVGGKRQNEGKESERQRYLTEQQMKLN